MKTNIAKQGLYVNPQDHILIDSTQLTTAICMRHDIATKTLVPFAAVSSPVAQLTVASYS